MKTILLAISLFCMGCQTTPENIEPVADFELDRYLGTWYEIARLDHSFERNLEQVTATYSLREDGGVKVLNKGYSTKKDRWKEAEGKAYFIGEPNVGNLKVSFFGPFYGAYVVFELDKENYQYALVAGPDTSYLWLLARTPTISPELQEKLVNIAKEKGFNTDELIYVKH